MKFSLAVLVLTSSLLGETTVLGFSAPTTRETNLVFGKGAAKSSLVVEPATEEQRNSAVDSVQWKSLVESLNAAEKLINDPAIFKQEEKGFKKEKQLTSSQELPKAPDAPQETTATVAATSSAAITIPESTPTTIDTSSITKVPAKPSFVLSKTVMRFKDRSGERSAFLKGTHQRVSITKGTGNALFVVRGKIAPQDQAQPDSIVNENHSSPSSLQEPKLEVVKKANPLEEMTSEEVNMFKAKVSFMTGAVYKARLLASAEKQGKASFLLKSLYKTRVLVEAVKSGQSTTRSVETEPMSELASLPRELLKKAASQAQNEYLLLNLPSTYYVHDVRALGL